MDTEKVNRLKVALLAKYISIETEPGDGNIHIIKNNKNFDSFSDMVKKETGIDPKSCERTIYEMILDMFGEPVASSIVSEIEKEFGGL